MAKLTVAALQQMKRDGIKIMAAVCYDRQIAEILDRAGVDVISVGDSGGRTLLGQSNLYEITMDQMVMLCQAVVRGVQHAVVNGDLPFGPVQAGTQAALEAAIRLVKEGGVEMVKLDDAGHHLDTVRAIANAGIPVYPQFGFSPQASMMLGGDFTARTEEMLAQRRDQILREAKELEEAGAVMLDLTNVSQDLYAEVCATVKIPVLGGQTTAVADGHIYTQFSPRAGTIEREPGRLNIARFIYEGAKAQLQDVRASKF